MDDKEFDEMMETVDENSIDYRVGFLDGVSWAGDELDELSKTTEREIKKSIDKLLNQWENQK